jgi:chaperonin GroES
MELEALFDAVIVKPTETEESTYGNIIVPDLGKDKNETGTVIAVGPGKPTITGDFIPTILKVGDEVVLPTMGFTKLPFDGKEFYVGPENQVLAKITNKVSVESVIAGTKVTEEEINNLKDISNE